MNRRNAEHWLARLFLRKVSLRVTRRADPHAGQRQPADRLDDRRRPGRRRGRRHCARAGRGRARLRPDPGLLPARPVRRRGRPLASYDQRHRRLPGPGRPLPRRGRPAVGVGFRAGGSELGGWSTLGVAAGLCAVLVKAESDLVDVARVRSGPRRPPRTSVELRHAGLGAARRAAQVLKIHQLTGALESSFLLLTAAVVDALRPATCSALAVIAVLFAVVAGDAGRAAPGQHPAVAAAGVTGRDGAAAGCASLAASSSRWATGPAELDRAIATVSRRSTVIRSRSWWSATASTWSTGSRRASPRWPAAGERRHPGRPQRRLRPRRPATSCSSSTTTAGCRDRRDGAAGPRAASPPTRGWASSRCGSPTPRPARTQRRHVPRLRAADPCGPREVTTFLGGASAVRRTVLDAGAAALPDGVLLRPRGDRPGLAGARRRLADPLRRRGR